MALGVLVVVALTGATTGISTQQIRTAAPGAVSVSGVTAAEGTSLAVCRADHTHSLTGTLPIANGGTGNTTGNAASANVINSTGAAGTFWANNNTWQTPAGTYTLPDATSSVTGGVRLTGQLAGTATSPTVASNVITVAHLNFSGTPSATTYARGDGTWNTPGGGGVTAVTAASPLASSGGSTPQISINASPTFTGTVTAGSTMVTGAAYMKGTVATSGAPLQNSGALRFEASSWSTTDVVAYPFDYSIQFVPTARTSTTGQITFGKFSFLTDTGVEVASISNTGIWGGNSKPMLTATWASSATANTLGIIGTGGVPLTSPTYAAGAPFGFSCTISTTRPSTTNGPRYGVTASAGSITRVSFMAEVGLAGTAPARTENLNQVLAVTSGTCTTGCTSAITASTVAQVFDDVIHGTGVMNASGTVSLQMAPSAAAAVTAQIGSYCNWY